VSKLANIFNIQPHELFMPEYECPAMPPASTDLLLRYTRETKELINMALDEIKDKYLKLTAETE
jgi:hypothetical protein